MEERVSPTHSSYGAFHTTRCHYCLALTVCMPNSTRGTVLQQCSKRWLTQWSIIVEKPKTCITTRVNPHSGLACPCS